MTLVQDTGIFVYWIVLFSVMAGLFAVSLSVWWSSRTPLLMLKTLQLLNLTLIIGMYVLFRAPHIPYDLTTLAAIQRGMWPFAIMLTGMLLDVEIAALNGNTPWVGRLWMRYLHKRGKYV